MRPSDRLTFLALLCSEDASGIANLLTRMCLPSVVIDNGQNLEVEIPPTRHGRHGWFFFCKTTDFWILSVRGTIVLVNYVMWDWVSVKIFSTSLFVVALVFVVALAQCSFINYYPFHYICMCLSNSQHQLWLNLKPIWKNTVCFKWFC